MKQGITVTPFRLDHDELLHPLPWRLMQNGPVTKYCGREAFAGDLAELGDLRFRVARFDVQSWDDDILEMRAVLRDELGMPSYTGGNFDAIADSLTDIEVPEEGGLVIALDNFSASGSNETLLDVLATASRYWLLFGRLFIVLFRTDDGKYVGPANLGATPVQWNNREFRSAKRAS